jgi:hypothetical protein
MKKLLSVLVLLALSSVFCTSAIAQVLPGDVDDSGMIDIHDVTVLIDYLLIQDASEVNLDNADVNGDEIINISDVVELIDMILLAEIPSGNEHEYVDLGLSSGTLWATCNIGANKPEEFGDYFAWGETTPKAEYNWSTYKWCNGTSTTLTKYCEDSSCGVVDNKFELDLEDDAAYVNWGPSWCMPTVTQIKELCACHCDWIQINGVSGYLFTGNNGNTLFLPAAGYYSNSSLSHPGDYGRYWSSTLALISPRAIQIYFKLISGGDALYIGETFFRYYGCSVRPVRMPQD